MEKLRREFDGYKVRAQSVLKQANERSEQEEQRRQNQEEINAVQKINDALNEKLMGLVLEIKTVQAEKSCLQDDHDRLMERHSLLLQVQTLG